MRADRRLGEGRAARAVLIGAALLVAAWLLLLPLAVLFVEALAQGAGAFGAAVTEPDALAAIRLTLLVAAIVVPANTVFGLAAAWCLTRFRFAGRRLVVALVALPFSVSPVVSGLVFVLLFGSKGWLGPLLSAMDVKVVFALPGIVLATMFVTLPFVALQLVPAMEAHGAAEEEAALVLGARGWQVFFWVTLPRVRWALLYGVLLCSARAMGEFGAVSVVSGRIRGLTETMPLRIEALYNDYQVPAAFGMASLLAGIALLTMAARATMEWRQAQLRRRGAEALLAA